VEVIVAISDAGIPKRINAIANVTQKRGNINNLEFFTEAEMQSGGRADFIISDWKLIIEVYETESKKSLLDKSMNYPQSLGFIPLRAGTSGIEIDTMLDDLSSTLGQTWDYYFLKWRDTT